MRKKHKSILFLLSSVVVVSGLVLFNTETKYVKNLVMIIAEYLTLFILLMKLAQILSTHLQ